MVEDIVQDTLSDVGDSAATPDAPVDDAHVDGRDGDTVENHDTPFADSETSETVPDIINAVDAGSSDTSIMVCSGDIPAIEPSTCHRWMCDLVADAWLLVPNDDATCEDGLSCTVNTCAGGECQSAPLDCDDRLDCTIDLCLEEHGGCVYDVTNCNRHSGLARQSM